MTTPASAAKALIEAALAWHRAYGDRWDALTSAKPEPDPRIEIDATLDLYRGVVDLSHIDPDGSILARQAEIGAAVERLPVGKALRVGGRILPPERWYRVENEDGSVVGGPGAAWDDPAAAIAAALGEP